MAETGSGIVQGLKQVVTAGTAVQLPTLAEGAAKTVTIQALSSNEGKIAVGNKSVVAAVGSHTTPKTEGILLNAGDSISLDIADLAYLWIDSTVSKDGVSWLALLA